MKGETRPRACFRAGTALMPASEQAVPALMQALACIGVYPARRRQGDLLQAAACTDSGGLLQSTAATRPASVACRGPGATGPGACVQVTPGDCGGVSPDG